MKLPLAPVLSVLALCCVAACDDGPMVPADPYGNPPTGEGEDAGPPAEDATTPVVVDAGGNVAKDSGGVKPGTGSDSAAACTLPSDWSQNPACDTCQQQNCCTLIQACASDTACTAIYDCQANCYSGIGPDGGALSTADGSTAEDTCASNCLAAGSTAAQTLFTPQDTCVNTTFCATPCE